MADVALLHVHGQEDPHDDVYVIGNRAGLLALRAAINTALRIGAGENIEVTTVDGEGYDIMVVMDNSDWQGERWQKTLLPYTSSVALDTRRGTIYPIDHEPQVKEDTHVDTL